MRAPINFKVFRGGESKIIRIRSRFYHPVPSVVATSNCQHYREPHDKIDVDNVKSLIDQIIERHGIQSIADWKKVNYNFLIDILLIDGCSYLMFTAG